MKKIFVAGRRGMVGSAICRQLHEQANVEVIARTRDELDLCDQQAVHDFMKSEKPDEVILAAAKVGGINANNTYPAEFIYQNLQIQNNVIHAAHKNDVQKLLFLGSSCIYPRQVQQPMRENALLTGTLRSCRKPSKMWLVFLERSFLIEASQTVHPENFWMLVCFQILAGKRVCRLSQV